MSGKFDRTLAAMWASYARQVIPEGESAAAVRNNMFAFYGGASYVLDLLLEIGVEEDEDVGAQTLTRLHEELRLFALQQGARIKPGN